MHGITKVLNRDNFSSKEISGRNIILLLIIFFFLSFQFLLKSIDLHYLKLKLDINKIYKLFLIEIKKFCFSFLQPRTI